MNNKLLVGATPLIIALIGYSFYLFANQNEESLEGKIPYDKFKKAEYCGTGCHTDIYMQWRQAMMSQAYTHEWDEIEYFKLTLPHAEADPSFKGVVAACNGCHTPMAFMAGDNPPPKPGENSRANESVTCDICHSISGFKGDVPFNFNYVVNPGDTKYGPRKEFVDSPNHKIIVSEFHKTGDFCGICHNEKSPFGAWVKSTHLEWKDGPYYKEGVICQDCHMTKAEGKIALMGNVYPDAEQHLFHGAHDPGKVKGVIELRVHPDVKEAEPGDKVKFTVALFNQKTGHKFPTGSVEDRIVWLHVDAIDSKGKVYHLPVDKKGFKGEEYTIAANTLAYQDLAIPLKNPNFKGVQRDGVPEGDRIFRMPYFDPNGNMTMMQWNTKSLGTDYRIGPKETKLENFTFTLPDNAAPGKLKVKASLYYQLLVKPVGELLNVPESETTPLLVNEHSTEINIID